jgi:hypothetical protein
MGIAVYDTKEWVLGKDQGEKISPYLSVYEIM